MYHIIQEMSSRKVVFTGKYTSFKKCVKAALRKGINLEGTDLSHKDLSGLKFKDTSLVNTNFRHSNLTGTSFVGCNCTGADFTGTNADLIEIISQLNKNLTNTNL